MDSNIKIIKPLISSDNSISLGFGTKFTLTQVFTNGKQSPVQLIGGSEDNIFYGLFDVEDVDFEIGIDNCLSDKNISVGINIGNKLNEFVAKSGGVYSLKTLSSNGKHLHFMSQCLEEGKQLVALSAAKHGLAYNEAKILCSRIGFEIEVEKEVSKECEKPYKYVPKGRPINIKVISLSQQIVKISIGVNNNGKDIKALLQEKEGIPPDQQRLIFCGKQLVDEQTLIECGIRDKSVIYLVLSLTGGGGGPPEPQIRGQSDGPTEALVGERGVICFGRKTNQKFRDYGPFIRDQKYDIKSFTIELRMKTKYECI